MPKIVDYEARRRTIAANAVSLFVNEGIAETNLSRIAQCCGFGRTTIYKYFKNKDEIFNYALDEIFERVEGAVGEIEGDAGLGAAQKLKSLLSIFIKTSAKDKERMILIMDLLLDRDAGEMEATARQRVALLRNVFERVLRDGMASGELREVNPRAMALALFSLVEAYVIQNSLVEGFSFEEALDATTILIEGLSKPRT